MKFTPRPYQKLILDFVFTHPRCNVWAGMGMGKTSVSIAAFDALRVFGEATRALVIAPKRVATSTWANEVAKWQESFGHLTVAVCIGTPKQRLDALGSGADITCINYDNLEWLVEAVGDNWQWDMVIADEATRLKGLRISLQKSTKGKEFLTGQGSVRAKALAKVAFKKVKRWVNLTGSPAPNGVQDLWGQNWYVDKGQRLGSSFSAFESRWFRNVQNSSGYSSLEPLKHAQPEIEAALKDITITIDPKDWFNIEKPIEHIVLVDLPPKARQIYDDLESKLFAEINEHEVEVFNAAARSNKCLQIGSGVVFVNPESREWVDLHDEKIDALRSIVEETNGEPLLVAYQFVPEKEKIVKAFPKAKVLNNDPKMIDDWNKGKIPMLIVHPASAGHGLNLQDGGRILVDFSTGWNLEYDEQVIERIGPTRQLQSGHNRAVYRYRIVAKDTIEQTTVLPRLITKATVQDALKDAMKRKYNL